MTRDPLDDWRVPGWFYDQWEENNIWRPGELDVDEKLLASFIRCVDNACDERPIHKFLEGAPNLLLGTQRTGHGTWVFSKKKLGSEFIPDFLIASGSSGGLSWEMVELESPCEIPYLKSGQPSESLRHGIAQVQDWRAWLSNNKDYAAKPKSQGGLGLAQIHDQTLGTIIIGRRDKSMPDKYNEIRTQIRSQNNISIMTYDRLLELVATEMLRFSSNEKPHDCVQRLRLAQ